MSGLIDKALNDKKSEEERKDFVDRITKREADLKKKKLKKQHPYNYLKYFLVGFFVIPAILVGSTSILLIENAENIIVLKTLYSFFIYVYTIPLMVIQEILNNVAFFFELEPIHLPIQTIMYYPFFSDFQYMQEDIPLFSVSLFEFRDNLFINLENVFGFIHEEGPEGTLKYTIMILAATMIQSYLFFLVLYHSIKRFKYGKRVIASSVLAEKWVKLTADPSKEKEAGELKKQIFSQTKKDKKVHIRGAYKIFFEQIDPVGTAVMEKALNKDIVVKKDFYEQIMEVFNANIPTKYYNIINFLSKEDFKLFNFKPEKVKDEDTLMLKQYTKRDFEKYKSNFNMLNGHLMLPILTARLRSYRTYDLHNLIREGKNNPEEFFLGDCTKEEINKIQRIAKEGYKLFYNPKKNQDRELFSVELRYPYSFSVKDIDRLEELREQIKRDSKKLILKYLSSDTNMHVYSVEDGEINQEAYKYFNADYQKLISKIISFNDLFFEILRSGDRYSWVNDPEGDVLQQNMVKLIHLNFNPNLFLERLPELNSGHFKSLYFVEEEISMENKISLKKTLEDESLKVEEFVSEHTPIKEVEFLSKQNIGYFRMLSIAQDILGVISDEDKINSFLDEFKIEYTKLK